MQIIATDFYQKQGEARYAPHAGNARQPRPHPTIATASPLATSVAAPSVWAIPKDLERRRRAAQATRQAAGHDGEPSSTTSLDGNQNFVWLRRLVEEADGVRSRRHVKALDIKGVHQVREYKRKLPRRRSGRARGRLHRRCRGQGQEGIELALFRSRLVVSWAATARVEVVKDRLGRVVEDIGDQQPTRSNGERHRAVHRFQGAVLRLPARARCRGASTRPRPAAWWCWTHANGRSVGPGELPQLRRRPTGSNLSGAQLRNRALTDVFEPGSTMKPLVVAAWALETKRVRVDRHVDQHRTGQAWSIGPLVVISDAHPHPAI